ncbi:GNAT family N-acetyltransferase [Saccharospirillum mangrovi]|uniref:GNAT family N-acetyltransferase n=1 Tax=Saccharospirillum mangrovi TaxID=2161747 RepID=UPI0013006821|nr:GNAT family N-acetyltransferase [Saccharospirillum mangrovi]
MSLKYFLYWCRIKRLKTFDDLRFSLENFPYRHFSYEQGNVIRRGGLRNKNNVQDYEIYCSSKTLSGHIMTIERANTKHQVCSIHHLSIHPDFRRKKLGKSCIKGFIKLVKYEKKVDKLRFEERLWFEVYYQDFFNNTLGATLVSSNPDVWELTM